MGFSRTCKLRSATAVGSSIIVFSAVFLAYWPALFDSVLHSQLALTRNSKSYDLWLETPIPLYIEFYFWNWTNPEQLEGKHQAKPNFVEFGPYVFRETRHKVGPNDKSPSDIGWNDNVTVTFRQMRTWHFEPSLSNGSLDDEIVTLNIPAVTAAFSCRNLPEIVKIMLDGFMRFSGTKLNVKRKVREFLFEGYSDPLLDLASIVPPQFVPISIPFDKFGWFYTRNNSASYDGIFNMRTGVDDIENLGVLANWDYNNHTPYYESYCGMVNGSAGEFFPPKRDKSSISLFSSDICRTIDLNFKEEVEVNGIKGYRYWGDDEMFANQTIRPDNWCWCPAKGPNSCPPHGALDVSTCKWGAPAYISFPHFFHADPHYTDSIVGMNPDPEKHQTFIDLEPKSGIPLSVAASFQINILLEPLKGFELLKNVPKIYMPALWFKQTARIDDKIGPQVKLITMIPVIGTISSLVILGTGVATLIVVSIFWLSRRCRESDSSFHGLVNDSQN